MRPANPAVPDGPPRPVDVGNWQDPDLLHWTYRHVPDVLPTATIARGTGPVADLAAAPADLGALPVRLPDGRTSTVRAVIATSSTDGWLVLHGGRVVVEEYPRGMGRGDRHLLQSVSKSLVASVAGALAGRGLLDVEAPVTVYVPELAGSGYAGATVRHLLDMRSGIGFREDYFVPDSDSRRLEASSGWAPLTPDLPPTIKDCLRGLRQVRPQGGPFEYRSCETDVLGWVCEAAGGERFAAVASELLWSRLGAEFDACISLDAEGTGVFDGGICVALPDLARFGAMVARGGVSLTGERVLPAEWVKDLFTGGPDSADAFATGPDDTRTMPGGRYRSKFWLPTASTEVALCIGIHGQLVHLNRVTGTVGVKLSSWPQPEDDTAMAATRAMFAAIDEHFATTVTPDGTGPRHAGS